MTEGEQLTEDERNLAERAKVLRAEIEASRERIESEKAEAVARIGERIEATRQDVALLEATERRGVPRWELDTKLSAVTRALDEIKREAEAVERGYEIHMALLSQRAETQMAVIEAEKSTLARERRRLGVEAVDALTKVLTTPPESVSDETYALAKDEFDALLGRYKSTSDAMHAAVQDGRLGDVVAKADDVCRAVEAMNLLAQRIEPTGKTGVRKMIREEVLREGLAIAERRREAALEAAIAPKMEPRSVPVRQGRAVPRRPKEPEPNQLDKISRRAGVRVTHDPKPDLAVLQKKAGIA